MDLQSECFIIFKLNFNKDDFKESKQKVSKLWSKGRWSYKLGVCVLQN